MIFVFAYVDIVCLILFLKYAIICVMCGVNSVAHKVYFYILYKLVAVLLIAFGEKSPEQKWCAVQFMWTSFHIK